MFNRQSLILTEKEKCENNNW